MHSSRLVLRHGCALLSTVLLALLIAVGAPPSARVLEATSGTTYLCSGYAGCRNAGYSDAGYGGASHRMYWNMYSGHNCTNYVAYRMIRAGMSTERPFGYPGNASHWGLHRSDITDQQPRVGAVAWWGAYDNGSGRAGHVAYVERVADDGRTIVISEDSWGGTFGWRRITNDSGRWPTGFIHFIDREIENTRRPQVSGTVQVGEQLLGTPGHWNPRGGHRRYQWFADGKALPGQTSRYLTPWPGLVGTRLSHRVTVTQSGWEAGRKSSRWTVPVAPGDLTVTEAPVVSGVPAVGQTLTLDSGSFSPPASSRSMRIQWLAGGTPIPGATGKSFELTRAQAGMRITARVTARRTGYRNKTVVSAPTGWVRNGFMRIAVSATVKGSPVVGARLRVRPGEARPNWAVSTSYQWLRDGRPIPGATGRLHRLTGADFQRRISARVTYTNPKRFGVAETVVANRRVRVEPTMTTTIRVGGRTARTVVIRPTLSHPVAPVTGTVSVHYAGRSTSARLHDGTARLVLHNVPHGTRRATIRFHDNAKFVGSVRRPWIKVTGQQR